MSLKSGITSLLGINVGKAVKDSVEKIYIFLEEKYKFPSGELNVLLNRVDSGDIRLMVYHKLRFIQYLDDSEIESILKK